MPANPIESELLKRAQMSSEMSQATDRAVHLQLIQDLYNRQRMLPTTPDTVWDIKTGKTVSINDPTGHLTGRFDENVIQDIIQGARRHNVDPYTALAIAAQETTFGSIPGSHINPLNYKPQTRNDYPVSYLHHDPQPAVRQETIDMALRHFKQRTEAQRLKSPSDEELILQSYNGMGAVQGGSETPKDRPMYGGQLNLRGDRDRPYGKRIIEIRAMLQNNPDLKRLVETQR